MLETMESLSNATREIVHDNENKNKNKIKSNSMNEKEDG